MKVRVNDVDLELAPGTSAIDAVFHAGYDVPYFCSQEYMSPIGACRMCLAKVGAPRKDRASGEWIMDEETGEPKIFWFPNPMATCTTSVMEGMVIDTLGEEARKAQRGMVEMTLINHPLDCPTCDKGGACELQDRAYEYGDGESRFVFDKRHSEKHHALSDAITLDRERCIHCKRCVRYFEEVPGDSVLDFIERGGHTYIGTIDEGLPSFFTGNITDICPVGALLDATSRFRGRNWEYDHTRSTGMDDAGGSAITIDARTGRIERIKAALNTQTSKTWIDDATRFGHEYIDSEQRLRTPLIRKDGALQPASWEEAAEVIKAGLAGLAEDEIKICLRADATLEEGLAAKALGAHLKTSNVDHFPRAASVIPTAAQASLTELATADAIFVIADASQEVPIVDLRIKDALKGVAPAELMAHGVPIADLRLKERMPRKREILTVAAPYRVDLMKHAGQVLTYEVGGEEQLLTALTSMAQGEHVNVPEHQDKAAALVAQLSSAEQAVIVYGGLVLASEAATQAVNALATATGAKVMALGAMANSYGLEAIEVLPTSASAAKAAIYSGLNPACDAQQREALSQLSLLVVHDCFPSETSELADVVLPAKSGYEKEGTVINLEGRFLAVNPAPVDAGQVEDFTGVVKAISDAYGVRLDGRSVRSARRAFKKTHDIDLAALPLEGQLAPQTSKAKAVIKSSTDGEVLLVPSLLRVDYLNYNPHLKAEAGGLQVTIHPETAAEHGLSRGQKVHLTAAGIRRQVSVNLSEELARNIFLLPAGHDQVIGQRLPLEAISSLETKTEVVI